MLRFTVKNKGCTPVIDGGRYISLRLNCSATTSRHLPITGNKEIEQHRSDLQYIFQLNIGENQISQGK